MEYIRAIKPHIFCFQELRAKVIKSSPSYNVTTLLREADENSIQPGHEGGGICIGIHRSLTFRDMSELVPNVCKM